MLRIKAKIIVFLFLLASLPTIGQIDENALKSAYLIKIANNFEWTKSSSTIKVGVYSNDLALFDEIKEYAKGKTIDEKEVIVDQILFPKKLLEYDIIYIGKERKKHLRSYIEIINKNQILLFSDQAPTLENSMINFYLSFDKKIKFKINSTLLKLHQFRTSNLMLILGGSDNDVLSLMEKKDSSLIREKTKRSLLQQENKEKENQLKEMVSKIELISNSLTLKNEEIVQKSKEIEAVNNKLTNQKRVLSKISTKISKTSKQLVDKEEQINLQEEKLTSQKKVFDNQNQEIELRNEKIKEQDEFLAQQKSMLNLKEKYLSYAYIFSLFLLGILIFAILSFLGKKKSGAKLIEQNKKLQRALDELQTAQAQLVQNEKMASLGMLTAGMAHEINNPMTFIYAGVNVLKAEIKELIQSDGKPENAENIDQIIADIEFGAQRVTEIVKSLQNFSRLNETDIKQIDLGDSISSTLTILGSIARNKNIEIINKAENTPINIECFPASINQLFVNLLSNAIDAVDEQEGRIEIEAVKSSDKLSISITDNGKGIEEKDLGKIFDPFFTTKDIGKGTGLGLSISYNIVKKHFGDIKVKSEINKGTTILIELPLTYRKPTWNS